VASPPAVSLRDRLKQGAHFLATQRHANAIRDGVVGALPLVLIGSVFLLLAQPPSATLQAWTAPLAGLLLAPYRVLGGAISVYVTFSAAYSLAKSYGLDPASCGLVALAAYFVAAMPVDFNASAAALPLARLGASGIFAGLVIAIGSVELTRLFVKRRWTFRLPASVPEVVARSFLALAPGFATIVLVFLLTHALHVDLIRGLELLAQPLLRATGSLAAALSVVLVDSGLWLLGVHASAALASLQPFWQAMLVGNMETAAQGGRILPHIASQSFYLWFVWQGGSGGTLALAIHLLRARSQQLRGVGRLGILPSLFNINEPILFGAPVVLNPRLAIPFVASPLVCALTAYLAFYWNWVTRPYLQVPWTLPAPLGAFFATGGDYRAILLQMFNLLAGFLLYWPFVHRYDRFLQAEEATAAAGSSATLPSMRQSP
jgi:cellobiose PTS system EIIC component